MLELRQFYPPSNKEYSLITSPWMLLWNLINPSHRRLTISEELKSSPKTELFENNSEFHPKFHSNAFNPRQPLRKSEESFKVFSHNFLFFFLFDSGQPRRSKQSERWIGWKMERIIIPTEVLHVLVGEG